MKNISSARLAEVLADVIDRADAAEDTDWQAGRMAAAADIADELGIDLGCVHPGPDPEAKAAELDHHARGADAEGLASAETWHEAATVTRRAKL